MTEMARKMGRIKELFSGFLAELKTVRTSSLFFPCRMKYSRL